MDCGSVFLCGHSSVGGAPPCQGGGLGFEYRCPLSWMAARTVNGLVGSEVGDSLAGSTPAPSAQPRWRAFCFARVAAPMMGKNSRPADRVTALCGHEELPGFEWTHWRLTAARGDPTVRATENRPADGCSCSTGDGRNGGARDHRSVDSIRGRRQSPVEAMADSERQSTPHARG